MANETTNVIAGIDTHADTHHVAVINEYGKPLADREFLAVGSGYRKIVDFITSYGTVTAVGVEGTGSYGAELARALRGEGLTVLEVNRPNRAARRLKGKSDPLDAYQAAQSVLDGRTTAIPKAKDGPVECLRILRAGAHFGDESPHRGNQSDQGPPRVGPGRSPGEIPGDGHGRDDHRPAAQQAFGPYCRPRVRDAC